MAEMLRLTVRADGGETLGYGHLQRTCAVARALRDQGPVEVRYLVHPTTDIGHIQRRGASVQTIEGDAWIDRFDPQGGPLLVDTYETTVEHLSALRERGVWTATFDDGCRLTSYPANLVIDSAPGAPDLPYRGEADTTFALGTSYVPLRTEFLEVDRAEAASREALHLLITFGGSDPEDLTARLLPYLDRVEGVERVTAVLGPGYRGRISVADAGGRVVILRNVRNMADLMAQTDVAVAASGGTALELAYMGVPSVLVPLTRDQGPIASALERAGAAHVLGDPQQADEQHMIDALSALLENPALRMQMAEAGRRLVDGHGASRIATAIREGWFARENG